MGAILHITHKVKTFLWKAAPHVQSLSYIHAQALSYISGQRTINKNILYEFMKWESCTHVSTLRMTCIHTIEPPHTHVEQNDTQHSVVSVCMHAYMDNQIVPTLSWLL